MWDVLLTLFLSLCWLPSSFAQQMNAQDSPCANIAVTSDLVNCNWKAKISSEKKLNALYKEILNKLDQDEAKHLTAAQNLWVRYRDANCEAERELYGLGTGRQPAYLACLETMTRERTEELRVTYALRLK